MRFNQRMVAIVDDERRVLESLQNLLESAGYRVLLFDSARVMLEEAKLEEVDCVISDIHMAPINGRELLVALQGRAPALPVILITGRESAESSAELHALGARFFFRKPLQSRALLDAIASCVV